MRPSGEPVGPGQKGEEEDKMSKRLFTLPIAVAVVLAMSAGASAQVDLDLSPYPSPYGGEVIDVPDGDIETQADGKPRWQVPNAV